ncbi:MAG TPA: metal-dependent hydrolase [Lachnospiraceae bacterium]|nr:metal-dependent hydrolase [Lachnospiraceae bacterium]
MIDFHTHIFPDSIAKKTIPFLENISHTHAHTDGTAAGLLASIEEAGLTAAVILPVATKPSQTGSILRFAEQFQEAPLISFGGIHPESEHYKEELRDIVHAGLKGVKLHPDYQQTYFNDIRYKRILDMASELGLIVSVHAGVDIGYPSPVHCTPEMIREAIDEVHPEKLILAHMGGWKLWDEAEKLLIGQPVYLDTAFSLEYMAKDQLLRIIRNHGADRILFATDSPWSGQKEYVERFQRLPLTQEERERIGESNARKLLGL